MSVLLVLQRDLSEEVMSVGQTLLDMPHGRVVTLRDLLAFALVGRAILLFQLSQSLLQADAGELEHVEGSPKIVLFLFGFFLLVALKKISVRSRPNGFVLTVSYFFLVRALQVLISFKLEHGLVFGLFRLRFSARVFRQRRYSCLSHLLGFCFRFFGLGIRGGCGGLLPRRLGLSLLGLLLGRGLAAKHVALALTDFKQAATVEKEDIGVVRMDIVSIEFGLHLGCLGKDASRILVLLPRVERGASGGQVGKGDPLGLDVLLGLGKWCVLLLDRGLDGDWGSLIDRRLLLGAVGHCRGEVVVNC